MGVASKRADDLPIAVDGTGTVEPAEAHSGVHSKKPRVARGASCAFQPRRAGWKDL